MALVSIRITGDRRLKDRLDAIRAASGRVQDACLVWAQAVAVRARDNARAKTKGGSFWRDQARRIRVAASGSDGARVLIGVEGAHWQTGGDIFPRNAKALTIPVAEEAKGKRAREFEMGGRPLFVIEPKSGNPDTVGVLGYSDDGEFHALYVLRRKVTHKADPWFPDRNEITQIGHRELAIFARRLAEAGR